MTGKARSGVGQGFEAFAQRATRLAGSTAAFACAAGTILLWAALGPVLGFSDTWQLAINTGTTIVTFLMVFLIQRTQNKDSLAIQLKLNELVAAVSGASNRMVNVEDLAEHELDVLHGHYTRLAGLAKRERSVRDSHSVDEARGRHRAKGAPRRPRRAG